MSSAPRSLESATGNPPLSIRVLITAVAALVITGASCSSTAQDRAIEENAVDSTITESTSPGAVAAAAIDVVASALDAKNSLDLDGWLAAHEGGRRQGIPLFAEQILMNANQHWEATEPCRVTGENTAGDYVVECLITNTDNFWGAGGIYEPRDLRFTVRSDGLITTDDLVMETNSFSSAKRNAFNRAFYQWMASTHPEVYSDIDPGFIGSNGPGFDAQDPDDMLIAIDYVDEFVAQSNTYPLDPTDP